MHLGIAVLAVLLVVSAAEAGGTGGESNPVTDKLAQGVVDQRGGPVLNPQASGPELDAITIPRMLSYQGRLTDSTGRAVPDSEYSVSFRLYTVSSGGSPFWTEIQNTRTKGGLFSVLLGAANAIGAVPDDGAIYLGMAVSGGAELYPRTRIVSAAYAYKTDTAGYALAAAGADHAWVRGRSDSVLYTVHRLGIARGESDNVLHGGFDYTHVNLGVACTTGISGHSYSYATVGGGHGNTAALPFCAVGGGRQNSATGDRSTVGGGEQNCASGDHSCVPGGLADSAHGLHGFAAGYHSVVLAPYHQAVAFNGMTTTQSTSLRCALIVKTGGTFTIDHPLDPHGKILNHYFIEGPEMRNIYDGEAVLDATGRAVVVLPDYFSALNRNPRVQLTGVGSSNVFVAQEANGNRFTIGGRPGTKVFWQVTGERKDVSAEATRRMMPVEQSKTGGLAGRMLDDEFVSGCLNQLEREGKAEGIILRTPAGRQRYEKMKQMIDEH